jgi:hypothetical protein
VSFHSCGDNQTILQFLWVGDGSHNDHIPFGNHVFNHAVSDYPQRKVTGLAENGRQIQLLNGVGKGFYQTASRDRS